MFRSYIKVALLAMTSTSFYSPLVASAADQNSALIADQPSKLMRLWYDEPAPDSDDGWVNRSIPMGNGYMGINVFGGTTSERIQITENSLYDWGNVGGLYRKGLNNFAEVYIDFDHDRVDHYERELDLNEGTSHVKYEHNGVVYSREYFTSYPDKVMVIRLSASKARQLSFTLRPTIPFMGEGKSGSVSATGDTLTLSGGMTYFNILFEGQFKVIPQGGKMTASNSEGNITVSDADSAVILIAVGTNYELDPKVFLTPSPTEKLDGFPAPHDKVSRMIADAAALSYEDLLANHQADYNELFDRVSLDLGATVPTITTDEMVDAYPDGPASHYLEELAFQFGRYMLICSSRAGTLPPNLQGIWNVYAKPPWSSQYLHDTNVQMAFAPAFSANLPELFESYVGFFEAYVPRQQEYATQYIKQYNPSQLDPDGDNGWSGPFWSMPYMIIGKSPVAGFGTGSWIAQMFWDYYDYTRDETLLEETVYPVMYEQAKFVSRFVQEIDGALLAKPSASPEQKVRNTEGTTFDQQMFYENHHNTLTAAKILGRTDDRLALYGKQLPLLEPIHVGKSGQIKEFRQEEFYADYTGDNDKNSIDPHHRHTSMLLGAYPGQLINDTTPAWLDAVEETLTLRTRKSNIGWARAERIAFWARVHDGDEAYLFYQDLLGNNFLHNLFNDHRGGPLFQADGNYGATAGVVELLMQSQDYVVSPLPALPSAWSAGSYHGLLARGNFEVSAQWSDGQANQLEVLSKSGGTLDLRYPNIAKAVIKTAEGRAVDFTAKGTDQVRIETSKGQRYVVTDIPIYVPVVAPVDLKIVQDGASNQIELSWTGSSDAVAYNLYRAVGNAPDYELVASEITDTGFIYKASDLDQIDQMTLKVTAVRVDGRESREGATTIRLLPEQAPASAKATADRQAMPNIVVIMADDMGWGDSGTYGHPVIQSPNLDALAAKGVKFTQGYSAAGVCSPSRSAILTGRTPYRNGVWRHLSGVHQAHLRASEITYPELLREVGYQTCHVGKWHLLSRQQFGNPQYPQVGEQGGYDYWFATHNNADPSHENPNNFIRNGAPVGELEGYSAPLVADEAINWINDLRDPEKPFVMSVWFHEPHKPIATDVKFSSLYPNESEKDATYYGNILQLDYALGEIMQALDANGLTDNTLLIFTSDNGPVPSVGGDSGGLRGNKRNDFEGGIRVPFIVTWPGHIEPGTVNETPVIGTDIFSTVLDIVNIEAPKDRTIDGVSMLPVFAGNEVTREIPMFWRTHVSSAEDRVAMRQGDWKIVGNDTLTEFMLFNVQEDWQEKNDMASSLPEKLEEMKGLLLETWNGIKTEGPHEWWESERSKPFKGATLNY